MNQEESSRNRDAEAQAGADLAAAQDLRQQQQERFSERAAKFAMLASDLQIQADLLDHLRPLGITSKMLAQALTSSDYGSEEPGAHAEPLSHALVRRYSDRIEAAARSLDLPLHGGVSASSALSDGVDAVQQRVMMTESSIVLVTAHLLLLCNRVAKLIARSVTLEQTNDEVVGFSVDENRMVDTVQSDPELFTDWMWLFLDMGVDTRSPSPGRTYLVTGPRAQVWMELREAMELFAIAHEYGHHIHRHSVGGTLGAEAMDSAQSHQMENEADFLGAVLSAHAGNEGEAPNHFAARCIGAVVLLVVLEYGRRAHHLLEKGTEPPTVSTSHPPIEDRLALVAAASEQLWGAQGRDRAIEMQTSIAEFLERIWAKGKDALLAMHKGGFRPVGSEDGWLPDGR